MNAIEITNLRKSYGNIEVLKGINLQVKSGSLLALLGPNGAGKTTTVRILATLLRFNTGIVKVFGHDVLKQADAVRRRVSLTGQFASVDDELTGLENLILVARLLGYSWSNARKRAKNLIHAFGLDHASKQQVKKYSGGMRRRLDIAASIIITPDLLFLDEPTTGLDPRSRRYIWDVIRTLRAAGTTVLLTTQYLEEADALADRIVIIDNGKIIADGTPDELKSSVGRSFLRIRLENAAHRSAAEKIITEILAVRPQRDIDPCVILAQVSESSLLAGIITALSEANIPLKDFSLGQPALDDVFLALTGQSDSEKEIA